MKSFVVAIVLTLVSAAAASAQRLPLRSGDYTFRHKFAEQPDVPSFTVTARIRGRHIVLIKRDRSGAFPKGVIAEGTLMWHAKSRQWIIGDRPSDRYAPEVGGCSDGPEVVDLQRRIYWTC
jgi:hypothetical protein